MRKKSMSSYESCQNSVAIFPEFDLRCAKNGLHSHRMQPGLMMFQTRCLVSEGPVVALVCIERFVTGDGACVSRGSGILVGA